MLTTLDTSADGEVIACGNSDGEVFVLDGRLRLLMSWAAHEMFITKLLLCPVHDGGIGALSKQPAPHTVLTLAGDNTCQLKLLPPASLHRRRGPLTLSLPLLMPLLASTAAIAANGWSADLNGDGAVDMYDLSAGIAVSLNLMQQVFAAAFGGGGAASTSASI